MGLGGNIRGALCCLIAHFLDLSEGEQQDRKMLVFLTGEDWWCDGKKDNSFLAERFRKRYTSLLPYQSVGVSE
jgi:hypothetical protein